MKIEKINIIKKQKTSDQKGSQCDYCCLDGFCLDTHMNCLEGEYFVLEDDSKELIKYDFIEVKEKENDNIE